eukprot:360359-Chlamydomonas_euryale.AAC.10
MCIAWPSGSWSATAHLAHGTLTMPSGSWSATARLAHGTVTMPSGSWSATARLAHGTVTMLAAALPQLPMLGCQVAAPFPLRPHFPHLQCLCMPSPGYGAPLLASTPEKNTPTTTSA